MIEAILAHQASQAMTLIGEVVDQGFDVRVYCRAILERVRNLLVACVVPSPQQVKNLLELGEEEGAQIIQQAEPLTEPYLQGIFSIISRTEDSLRGSSHPRFLIEAAVVRAALLDPSATTSTPGTEQAGTVKPQPTRQPKPSSPIAPVSAAPSPLSNTAMPTEKPRAYQKAPERHTPSASPPAMAPVQSPPVKAMPAVPTKSVADIQQEPPQPSPKPIRSASDQTSPLDWEHVVDRMLQDHPNVGSFLEKGSVVTLEADHVVIGFSKRDAIARWRTDKPENRALLANMCEEMAGRPMRVQVIELHDGQERPPSMGEIRAKKKHEDNQDLMQEVKAHPLVKEALELFGGELASAQRHPQKEEAP
jgi:DNA polymerase-3 subunit gamma/tau